VLKALSQSGGMLGFSLYPLHLKGGSDCTLEAFCEMAARTAELMGAEHLGIGSDLCQDQPDRVVAWMRNGRWTRGDADIGTGKAVFPPQPAFFRDNRDLARLRPGLRAAGFSEEECDGLLGDNWARFFKASFA
jgi:microsomal dipeptidase-like Zn-dependent dipeptidase